MPVTDFIVIGSSGGGGTISWVLAKAGFRVLVLEQGPDVVKDLDEHRLQFNPASHDEYRFRLGRPADHRRPRGDYNTFRATEQDTATPFSGAWTASILGGGSIIWGTWSFRALPIDFRLRTHFKVNSQLDKLEKEWGYSIPDWPVSYEEMEPFYNVAETLLAVSGDREALNTGIRNSEWFKTFGAQEHFRRAGNWQPTFPFPCSPYPRTPVGHFVYEGAIAAGLSPLPLPSGMVAPGSPSYSTREALKAALSQWGQQAKPGFWTRSADDLWSERVRDACNLCGYCGEYLCWGKRGPKSGTRASTLRELQDLRNAEVRTHAKAFELMYDARKGRATGVRYLDLTDPDRPRVREEKARFVIVACGAVQSARLLLLSGSSPGLGNATDQVGRYATFHLFGLGATCLLPEAFQGLLHSELGHTGNTMSFAYYFVRDDVTGSDTAGKWWKAGTIVSTARKNPLDNADTQIVRSNLIARDLLAAMERYNRSLELRLTGDDLPMARNRVDLDPTYVDEYGLPVARITRSLGPNEKLMFTLMKPKLEGVFQYFRDKKLLRDTDGVKAVEVRDAIPTLIGDHQMGTCRMGDDPTASVVDRYCRLHDVPNVFVVDSSFFPTGFGLNPMVTVMANALRVGTWIVDQTKRGTDLERPLEGIQAP